MRRSTEEAANRTPSEKAGVDTQTPSLSVEPSAGPSNATATRPVKRKPRQSLEAMSAALDKGKKMTTLEKVNDSLTPPP